VRRLTDEQLVALERFRTRRPLKIAAFAGAGKTSTLQALAQSRTTSGIYLAFNRAIAAEAKGKFPKTVDCRTTHSIAMRAVQPTHRFSTGKMTGNLYPRQLSAELGLRDHMIANNLKLDAVHQAHLLIRTVRRFCQSASSIIGPEHVPQYGRLLGLNVAAMAGVRTWAVSESNALWARMTNYRDPIPLGHDGYLKLWASEKPKLAFDYILLDEAQDTNPVVLDVLSRQTAQIVYVGDRHQQIYEWRGAINAMENIKGCAEAYLTQSFRFGSVIADAASRVLKTLGETMPVRGNPAVSSNIGNGGRTDLARTNATVIKEILEALNAHLRPYVMGGTEDLKRQLSDVFELKQNKPGTCPEFFGFRNWAEVVAFSGTEEGEDLRTFVQLVEQHGEKRLWKAVISTDTDEASADVVLSTAHKAKGREWDSVRLASDFLSSKPTTSKVTAEAEVRLFYVAMTRAKRMLHVQPELLENFASGAWQKQWREAAPRQSRSESPVVEKGPVFPSPPRSHEVGDITSARVRQGHPGAAPHRPAMKEVDGSPAAEPAREVSIGEIVSAEAQSKLPAATIDISKVEQTTPSTDFSSEQRGPTAPRGPLWKRIARLLIGNP
jgi:hypothetical protein